MITALRLELRRGRLLVLWVGLVGAVYAGVITAFYPTIIDNAEAFAEMLEFYPKELMAAFGITTTLADPGTFVNSYVFQFMWPIVAALGAIFLATRLAADADTGFLDLPLSTRLPRPRYLTAAILAQIIGLAALTTMTIGAVVLVDQFIEPDFDVGRLVLAGVHAFLMAAAIAGVTTALSVALLDRGRAGGIVAAILILMYLLNVIAQLSPDVRDLGRLSAFRYFDLKGVIDTGAYPVGDSLVFLAFALGGWLLAFVLFRRRDLAA